MSNIDLLQAGVDRRRFLGLTGGLAAAGTLVACGQGGTYEGPGTKKSDEKAAAATPTAAAGSSDHSSPLPTGADRPKASGKLAAVYDAKLAPVDPNPNKTLVIEAREATIEVAAGVKMDAWSFDGVVPGKVVHVRQGDNIDFTLRNTSKMGHSIDFHAAQTPWNVSYKTIAPGDEVKFKWKANYPGVFMYHRGTGPVLQHISNGMYGAVVVDPTETFAPAKEYVLVESEFYLSKATSGNWEGDLARMQAVQPDFVVFNGAANQYQQETLAAAPGELIRLHVMNAGPTLFSAFHVIGALFDKVYVDGNPANVLRGIQTWTIPPGGGATFELRIPEAGKYPFVTHTFAYTGGCWPDRGEVAHAGEPCGRPRVPEERRPGDGVRVPRLCRHRIPHDRSKGSSVSIEWQTSTLANGLQVVTTPVPTAQSVSVNLFVGIGSRGEDRRTNGLSHYMEHMLFKGTPRRPDAIVIAEAIEGAGGVLNAYTSKELTCYWNQVPFDKLALAMDVLADMYRNSLLDQAEIDRERTVVQQEIRRAFDQPGAWASELLSRATFGDQPIGWPIAGTIETVEAMQRDDFVAHVAAHYVPSNTVVSVAGNTTHADVLGLAEELLGNLPAGNAPDTPPALTQFAAERVVVETREIAQCNMGISLHALPRKDPDRYPLMVLNTILGRGMSSRLFKEVRERRGLAYSVGSGVGRYSDIGTMSVSAGVTLEHLEEATQVIRNELFRTCEESAGDEEITKARDFSTGNFRLGLESTMALAQRAGESLLMTGEIEPIDDVVASIAAVTAADVQRVARRLFKPGGFAMAVVGPGGDPDRLRAILEAA